MIIGLLGKTFWLYICDIWDEARDMNKSSGYVSSKFVNYTLFEMGLNIELDHYETYCVRMESVLEEEKQRLQFDMEQESANLSGYEKANHHDEFFTSYQYKLVTDVFPDIQRKSGLISLYAMAEKKLSEICGMYEKKGGYPLMRSDLKNGKVLEKVERYLSKVVQIDFPRKRGLWKEIKMIRQLRNKCVHCNGIVSPGNKGLVKYINESDFLDERRGLLFQTVLPDQYEPFQIKIKQGYLENCISVFKEFFKELFVELEKMNKPKLQIVKR